VRRHGHPGTLRHPEPVQVRGLRNCLRVLRGQPLPGQPQPDDVDDALTSARASGFHRPLWTALAMGALCRALQGKAAEAVALLVDLAEAARKVPMLASGEWAGAAAHAGAIAGPDAARLMYDLLSESPHQTPWSQAALRTTGAALAVADGDHLRAARLHEEAVEIYARLPSVTDRMISLAMASDARRRAGDTELAEAAMLEVRTFAQHNKSPGLLRLAQPPAPLPSAPEPGTPAWSGSLAS